MKICWSQDYCNEYPMCVRLFENTSLILTILHSERHKEKNEYKRDILRKKLLGLRIVVIKF